MHRLSKIFDQPATSIFNSPLFGGSGLFDGGGLFDLLQQSAVEKWAPSVDVRETEDAFIVEAEVPGIPTETVEISLVDNRLTLSGEKITEVRKDDEEGTPRLIERSSGSFTRSIKFRTPIDQESAKAVAKDGLLTITIKKRDLPRQIKVDTESE